MTRGFIESAILCFVALLLWGYSMRVFERFAGHSLVAKDTSRIMSWLYENDSKGEDKHVIFGSSNVVCALDPDELDSLTNDRWFNNGQFRMTDFELIDYSFSCLANFAPGEVQHVYIELVSTPISEKNWDWRSAELITLQSILQIALSESKGSLMSGVKDALQLVLMKTAGPLHRTLHKGKELIRRSPNGAMPNEYRMWHVKTARDSVHLEEIESLRARSVEIWNNPSALTDNEFKANQFPYPRLHDVVALCEEKEIEVTFLFCPTTSIGEHVKHAVQSYDIPLFLLDFGLTESPFIVPKWMRDPIHLNKHGAARVSENFALYLKERKN
jgi:hypothetical protein